MTSSLDMNDFGLTEMNFDELTLIDGGGFWQGVKDFFSGFGDGASAAWQEGTDSPVIKKQPVYYA